MHAADGWLSHAHQHQDVSGRVSINQVLGQDKARSLGLAG